MLTNEQIDLIEYAYKHSDCLVFTIEDDNHTRNRVFIVESSDILKHPKEATIEMQNCIEVDETCFEDRGYGFEYYGEYLYKEPLKNIILSDPYPDNENIIESLYYEDEVKEVFNQDTKTLEVENW